LIAPTSQVSSEFFGKRFLTFLFQTQFRSALALAVEKANAEVMPSSKYAQLLESVEAIPALNESNRVLRQTKEKLEKEIVDVNAQLDEAAKSVEPLKQQLREAEERQDKLEAELEAMQGDNQRWRQRANQLIEKNQVFNFYLTYYKNKL
jgi:chromosome segregation ATPase